MEKTTRGRKKTNSEKRSRDIAATILLTSRISDVSKLPSAKIEEMFEIGDKTGRVWNRYLKGERAMNYKSRATLALKAIKIGLLEPLACGCSEAEMYAYGATLFACTTKVDHIVDKITFTREERLEHERICHEIDSIQAWKEAPIKLVDHKLRTISALQNLLNFLDRDDCPWEVPHPSYYDDPMPPIRPYYLSVTYFLHDVKMMIDRIDALVFNYTPDELP